MSRPVRASPCQAITVTDVADQEAQVFAVGMALPLVELLGLVAAEDAHDGGLSLEETLDESGADGAGAAGDQHLAPAQHLDGVDGLASCRRRSRAAGVPPDHRIVA